VQQKIQVLGTKHSPQHIPQCLLFPPNVRRVTGLIVGVNPVVILMEEGADPEKLVSDKGVECEVGYPSYWGVWGGARPLQILESVDPSPMVYARVCYNCDIRNSSSLS